MTLTFWLAHSRIPLLNSECDEVLGSKRSSDLPSACIWVGRSRMRRLRTSRENFAKVKCFGKGVVAGVLFEPCGV